jgi:hypothetical protein
MLVQRRPSDSYSLFELAEADVDQASDAFHGESTGAALGRKVTRRATLFDKPTNLPHLYEEGEANA